MPTTKISSDQLTFRSANTGETLLDTYLENAEIGGLTIAQLLAQVFNPGDGSFDATLIDIELQTKPGFPDTLQYRVQGGAWIDFATIPTGAGTGDMLAANNLGDLASIPAAKVNLLLGALADANTVSTALIDNSAVTLAKLANGTPTRLLGFDSGGAPAVISVGGGNTLAGNVITSAPTINDATYSNGIHYTAGNPAPVGFALAAPPASAANIFVSFDGLAQDDGLTFTFTPTTITFTNGIPALVQKVRIRTIT